MSADRLPAPDLPSWLQPLLPLRRYSLQVGDHRMHVMEAGEGRPVLMLHGNPTWGFLYRKIAARLSGESLRLVIPDLVGLGLSDKPRSAAWHTLENHAEQVALLCDLLELDDVVFVGQDWGGPIGTLSLAMRPGRMTGTVLMNTVVGPPKEGFKATGFHRLSQTPLVSDLLFRGLGFPQIGLHLAQGDRSSIRGAVARAYRWPLRRFRDRIAPLALARMVPDSLDHPSVASLTRVHDHLDAFEGPAALVWGERDPVLGRLCNRAARVLPQATVVRNRAGHFIQEEEPEAIADAIRAVCA